ncbi:hypothetical protein [Streptomyces sp. NBC_00989]|uniref:hypothetical protein n=1 Tax=Streptomyces sp. NBC_00989 TaxID=2903705 RepID=UPI002F916134|nr:hypothetical protein OG714_54255 [Streptomyces sp. NBC_00989]
MDPLSAGYATATAAGDRFVLLDHDINGWTMALIVAVIAAFIYEMFMAMTKAVTRRIPFLILRIARMSTPEDVRAALYEKWTADLWDILDEKGFFVAKFVRAMLFATQLALYGARSTAAVVSPRPSPSPVMKDAKPKSGGTAPEWLEDLADLVFGLSRMERIRFMVLTPSVAVVLTMVGTMFLGAPVALVAGCFSGAATFSIAVAVWAYRRQRRSGKAE